MCCVIDNNNFVYFNDNIYYNGQNLRRRWNRKRHKKNLSQYFMGFRIEKDIKEKSITIFLYIFFYFGICSKH